MASLRRAQSIITRSPLLPLAIGLVIGLTSIAYSAAAVDDTVAQAIRQSLERPDAGVEPRPGVASHRRLLRQFYEHDAFAPVWLDDTRTAALVSVLGRAASHGLAPREGTIDSLPARIPSSADSAAALAARDFALSSALIHLLVDAHYGRIDPRAAGLRRMPARAPFDIAQIVRSALDEDDLQRALTRAAPRWPLYDALREALARYRALDESTPLQPIRDERLLHAGALTASLPNLRARLLLLGDLAPDAITSNRYDEPMVAAVRQFQRRHGLADDGIIGPATRRALNVPLAARVRQIELTLERLRWLPALDTDRVVAVNVPSFTLWGVDRAGAHPTLHMQSKVIVGQATDTRTPLFSTQVRGIEFNPYWNVPASILRKEILPLLRKRPAWLTENDMEIVTREAPPRVIATLDIDALARLDRGGLRVRQRPGAANALGRLKLVMPNTLDIYLHDTPTRTLFAQARRDFSHGCIRVENIIELAAFLLGTDSRWDTQRIRETMDLGRSRTVALPRVVPVVLLYLTTMIDDSVVPVIVWFTTKWYGMIVNIKDNTNPIT